MRHDNGGFNSRASRLSQVAFHQVPGFSIAVACAPALYAMGKRPLVEIDQVE